MLPAAARMRRRAEFTTTVRGGRRAGASTLVVHLRLVGDGTTRIGFVVPRSVGNAVTRNLVRRRLRHLCRERLASLPEGCRIVVRAQPTAALASSARLGRDLEQALGRVLPAVQR